MTGQMLVIAEKPSVAKSLAKVLGAYKDEDGYMEGSNCIVSWCFGHLAEYATPDAYDERYGKWDFTDLPIIPATWKLTVPNEKAAQFRTIKELLHREDVDLVVNACDAGREGEMIFWNVYEMAEATLPVKRLWISSMEESAIQEGFRTMKDAIYYQGLRDTAVCRARADWLVGINATRGFTTKYGTKLLVGRVQSPNLSMVVERQKTIDNFVKEAYFKVTLKGDGIVAVSDAITDEDEAETLVKRCNSYPAIITKVEKKQNRMNPPKLYDLTSLQRDANRLFGYTAQQSLDALQDLYEKKFVTYPRTDSRYITSDMAGSISDLLEAISECFSFAAKADEKNVNRLICDSKVSDHHALLPTKESLIIDISDLMERHRNIYLLIAARLVAAASGVKIVEETKVVVSCAEYNFTATGKRIMQEGYERVEDAFIAGYVKPPKPEEAEQDISVITILDELFEGMQLLSHSAEKSKHFTTPPKHYTEDTLLSAMEKAGRSEMDDDVERKGIGTPATRAGTIEKLVSTGYIARKGRKLLPTAEGIILTDLLPDKMKSPSLTAAWENWLRGIEKGKTDAGGFMAAIIGDVNELVDELSNRDAAVKEDFDAACILGICPKCGGDVIKGKYGPYCKEKCGMGFRIFGKIISDEKISALLNSEPIRINNKSKKSGKIYTTQISVDGVEEYSYEKDGKMVSGWRFKLKSELVKKKKGASK